MRVLHLIPTLQGGGAEKQLVYLAGGLHALGCEVHVGVLHGGTHLPRLSSSGAIVHRLASRGHYDPRIAVQIVRLIRAVRPDLVQTWILQMDVLGGAAALVTRTPWILSERSSRTDRPPTLRARLRRTLGRRATAIVANSAPGLEPWVDAPTRRYVVPNAVLFAEIDAARRDTTDYGTAKIVLFAGRLTPGKNVRHLVAALREVIAQRDVTALICGVGPLEAELRASIAVAGCGDRLRLMGYCENLPGLMKRADVLVAPSWFEGHPNVPIEAAAAGCPLVVSDIPAHRAWLDEGSALFADPGDPASLAHAVVQALDDPVAARVRAGTARERVRDWTVERAALAYLRIYQQLRAHHTTPSRRRVVRT